MTDNEIVKALEIFVNSVGKGFVFANVDIKKDGINDFKHIDLSYDEIFDLLNRLQKSKKYYKKSRDECLDKVMFISKQCDELQAENEKLKSAINGFRGYDDKIKSEAYKKCIEKLKAIFGEWIYSRKTEDLLKELVGDTDA